MSVNTTDKIYYAYTPYVDSKVARRYGIDTPRATVALRRVGNEIHYGVSICSSEDNFEKKKGRQLAEDRMKEGFGKFPIAQGVSERFDDDHALSLYFLNNMINSIWCDMRKAQHKIGLKKTKKNPKLLTHRVVETTVLKS